MNAKSILGAALVAFTVVTYAADAAAKCEIRTVQEVQADGKLVIEGTALTQGTRVPEVFFAGVALPVDGGTLTATHIEADLSGFALDPETKDYLLAIRRSPGDTGCRAQMVTVVRPVRCPTACEDGIVAFVNQLDAAGGTTSQILCSFDAARFAGAVTFDANLPGPDGINAAVLLVSAGRCLAAINPDPPNFNIIVDLDITGRQQAVCAAVAKASLVFHQFIQRAGCDLSP